MVVLPVLCCLAGCETAQPPVAQTLAQQHMNQSIDRLVLAYGPPASTFALTSGDKMHEWQMAAGTDGNGHAVQCKIRAVSSTQGIVKSITTNDAQTGSGSTWCTHALSGKLANVQDDDAAAAAAVAADAAIGTALLGALLF
jgi:hypothetical protein